MEHLLAPVHNFLLCPTPTPWLEEAIKPERLPMILIDHLVCELKAAQSAMYLIRKYAVDKSCADALLAWLQPYEALIYKKQGNWQALAGKNQLSKTMLARADAPYSQDLIDKMVLLIKEELHHFYQVLEMMAMLGVDYQHITPGRYARMLMRHVTTHEPQTLVDKLIVGAYIEARSCERFAALAPHVEPRLAAFYRSLLRSEARHYEDYLTLAQSIADEPIAARVAFFAAREAELIQTPDADFKFHSGIPQ